MVPFNTLFLLKNKYSTTKCIAGNRLITWLLVYEHYLFGSLLCSFLGKIFRWDRLCANKSVSIFHCNSVLFSQASNFYTSITEDTDHKDGRQRGTLP